MSCTVIYDQARPHSCSWNELSRRFCYLLDIGGWKRKKEMTESEVRLSELIDNVGHDPHRIVIGGSLADGTNMADSDSDDMIFIQNAFVVTDVRHAANLPNESAVFLMVLEGHRPCYPSLRLLRKGYYAHGDPLILCLEEHAGSIYASSAKYLKDAIAHAGDDVDFNRMSTTGEHGPCVVTTTDLSDIMDSDMVDTIRCTSWPPCAKEWVTRHRQYGTPSKKVIQEVEGTSCSVVPLGNPTSKAKGLEWRISFLLGERILMWNLTKIQYYCMIYLKIIRKSFIPEEFHEIVSSYTLKTILFWEIEETSPLFWQDDTFLDCMTNCLIRLHHCVKEAHLPHYFVRENNIFTGKISPKCSQSICEILSWITENIITVCHDSFDITCSSNSCVVCHDYLTLICTEEAGLAQWVTEYYFENLSKLNIYGCKSTIEGNLDTLAVLSDTKATCNIRPEHINIVRNNVATDIGIWCHRNSYADADTAVYMSLAEQFLLLGSKATSMCPKLHLSSFYYQHGQYDESLKIINQFKESMIFFTSKNCTLYPFIRFERGNMEVDDNFIADELSNVMKAEHVFFEPMDASCTHHVISMECMNCTNPLHLIEIHPFMYLFFLQFQIFYQYGDADNLCLALEWMEESAYLLEDEYASSVAFNLVGHSYFMVGDNLKALDYFWKSYNSRPSLRNPCLFHALVVIWNCIE